MIRDCTCTRIQGSRLENEPKVPRSEIAGPTCNPVCVGVVSAIPSPTDRLRAIVLPARVRNVVVQIGASEQHWGIICAKIRTRTVWHSPRAEAIFQQAYS